MNDELGNKVQQILKMLGQENVPDNLMDVVSLLASSLESKKDKKDVETSDSSESTTADKNANERALEIPAGLDKVDSSELLDKARVALDKLNTSGDPRINLLQAIKPFMNSKRQKKIGGCIQLLKVASLSRLINEQENRRGDTDAL